MVGSAQKAAKRFGLVAQKSASRSLTRAVISAASEPVSFCAEGAPCEITCTSTPASSISLSRSAPRSNRRSVMEALRSTVAACAASSLSQ